MDSPDYDYESDDGGVEEAPQSIDLASMSNNNTWNTEREHQPSLQQNVLLNPAPRRDFARMKSVYVTNQKHGRIVWSKFAKCQTLFRIPQTLTCDRTFARNDDEAYYLGAMDAWLNASPGEMTIQDIPYVKRSFHKKLMYAFGRRPGYFMELFERRRSGLWLPFDHYENMHYGDVELSELYPVVEAHLKSLEQPSALPVPVRPVVYYFHTELREAQRRRSIGQPVSERQGRLLFCLDNEYYVSFLAMWWSEASHGKRQFVVPRNTVHALQQNCAELTLIDIKPVQVILEYMRTATTRNSEYHVWLGFRNDWMEESTFVWAKSRCGEFDPSMGPRRVKLYADEKIRRIMMTAHSTKMYKRNTVLQKKIPDPELDKIPGLLDVVREQNWNLHGDMRVGDLITYLSGLYSATRNMLNTLTTQARPLRYAPDGRFDDRYIGGESRRPRVGYHEECEYQPRYRNDNECYDYEDWFRSRPRTPPQPPRHPDYGDRYREGHQYNSYAPREDLRDRRYCNEYRGWDGEPVRTGHQYNSYAPREGLRDRRHGTGYRDLDGEAVRRFEHVPRQYSPSHSPHFTPEKVYELPTTTPGTAPQGDPGAGPSTLREPPASRSMALISAKTAERTAPIEPILSRPASCRNWLLATPRAGTPFGTTTTGNGGEQRPDHTGQGDTTVDNTASDGPDTGPDSLTDADYTKQGSGNVSWGLTQHKRNKRPLQDVTDEGNNEGRSRNVRSKGNGGEVLRTSVSNGKAAATTHTEAANADPILRLQQQDPVVRKLCERHPSSTAVGIASRIRGSENTAAEPAGDEGED